MNLRLGGIAFVGALILAAPAGLVRAQSLDSSPIAKTLNDLVIGQSVRTKMPIVLDFVIYHRSYVEPIDTEFYENGTVDHHVSVKEKGGTGFVKAYELKDSSKLLQPGSRIQLEKISYYSDSIEILWFYGSQAGTISLMLGPGYETWPTDRIVNFLYKIISIPAIDERIDLENQYKTMTSALKLQVDSAQTATPPLPLELEIEKKTALYGAYRDLDGVATKLRTAHDPIISSDSTDYAALAEGVENQLIMLREAAEADRKQKSEQAHIQAIRNLQKSESGDEANLENIFLQLDKSEPRTESDLGNRAKALQSAQETASDWLQCLNLLALAHQDTTADRKRLDAANQHIVRLQASLDAARGRFQSRSLDAKYQSMVSRLAELKSSYAASFGTPAADAAKMELRNQLNQMIANRESAAAMGNSAANQQAEQLRVELSRLH
jgi:hypothetical protein